MVIKFGCYEFDVKYERQCSNISAGNTLPREGIKSAYWMFDNEISEKRKGNWTLNASLDSGEVGAMNHMKEVLFQALNTYNQENNIEERHYNCYLPGIVKTRDVQNQVLHLDSMVQDYNDAYNELIVHIPLESEGQWLRIRKEILNDNNEVVEFIHKMIHIPIGSGVLLSMKQLHGGHYGTFWNARFHCVIFTKDCYEGTSLFLTIAYLNERYDAQNASEILTNRETKVHVTPTITQMAAAVDKTRSRIGKLYWTKFLQKYNYSTFHGYVAPYEQKYGNE